MSATGAGATASRIDRNRFAAVVVNFNTSRLTLRCVASLVSNTAIVRLVVVDNGSCDAQLQELRCGLRNTHPRLVLIENDANLGFAEASNRGIAVALGDPAVSHILFLNSDAEATAGMAAWLDAVRGDLCAARVLSAGSGEVDSMGIVMYASALASNRQNENEPLFGPTGGCAVYSRRLLDDLRASHGYCFDVDFFCYAEDTDLAARSILLGYRPEFDPRPVALHVGQASTGSKFNNFILYHGIRNSIWTVAKCFPAGVLWRRAHKIIALHMGIVIMHVLQGRGRTVWRLYADAAKGFTACLDKRRRIAASRRIGPGEFARYLSPRFYDRGYVAARLSGLRRRKP